MEVTGKTKIKGKLFLYRSKTQKKALLWMKQSLPKKYWVKKVTEAPDKRDCMTFWKEGKKWKAQAFRKIVV